MWTKILQFAAKYGKKALTWVKNNKEFLLSLGEFAYEVIKDLFG